MKNATPLHDKKHARQVRQQDAQVDRWAREGYLRPSLRRVSGAGSARVVRCFGRGGLADRVRLGQQLVDNLEMGIEYTGICRNELHQVWLANVADRDACCLAVEDTPLFEHDLSAMIKKHFKEILDQGKEREDAEDHDPGSDVEI